jgi:non-canonical (house-cleaning) NTP pyrophosphatase
MKIALASQSRKKIDAVKLAFQEVAGVELLTIKAPSNVHEQPLGDETFQGARNRLAFTRQACADADIYISIENGLFMQDGKFVDKAVVTVETANGEVQTTLSDGVEFPIEYVEKTSNRKGDFKEWTVGETMAEAGIVQDNADPHLCLNETTRKAVKKLGLT